jgi:hypothetical protein
MNPSERDEGAQLSNQIDRNGISFQVWVGGNSWIPPLSND